jgi:NAD(P)-dependent dehydrogenase (short-subunit alcohol dehydrogenase family)
MKSGKPTGDFVMRNLGMRSAAVKIFVAHGDPKQLRTAELSNWTGKAVAGPRGEFESVLAREKSQKSGVYFRQVDDTGQVDQGWPASITSSAYYSSQLAGHNASKAALNMLTVQLSGELRETPHVVNSISPGYAKTDLTGNKGFITADQAAKTPVQYALLGEDAVGTLYHRERSH